MVLYSDRPVRIFFQTMLANCTSPTYTSILNQILQTEIRKLKDQMQELHRDLTKHHSLINAESTEEILERSVRIDEQIEAQYSAIQTLRTMFEKVRMKDVIVEQSLLLLKHSKENISLHLSMYMFFHRPVMRCFRESQMNRRSMKVSQSIFQMFLEIWMVLNTSSEAHHVLVSKSQHSSMICFS